MVMGMVLAIMVTSIQLGSVVAALVVVVDGCSMAAR